MTRQSSLAPLRLKIAGLALACLALSAAPPAFAQMPGGPGMEHGGMHGGMHMGPGSMWWKNPRLIQGLGLTPEQQKKMSDIFEQSRIELIDRHANVEKAEVPMEAMLAANPPETAKVLAQIDKIAQARAELEKADARMLLGIRGVLTPEQWTKLQAEERSHHGGMDDKMGKGDKGRKYGDHSMGGGPGGPGGPQGQMPAPPPAN